MLTVTDLEVVDRIVINFEIVVLVKISISVLS